MRELYEQCLALACERTRKVREEYKGVDLYAFGGGSGGGSSAEAARISSNYERQGTSTSEKSYTLPTNFTDLINNTLGNSDISSGQRALEDAFLSTVFARSAEPTPGLSTLEQVMAVDPTAYTGLSHLNTMIARDPYSTEYEQGTQQEYDKAYATARSAAQSGPANVRGGQARQGFELADLDDSMSRNRFREVRGQQQAEAGQITQAVQLANQIESMRRGSQLQAQGQMMQGQNMNLAPGFQAMSGMAQRHAGNMGAAQMAAEYMGKPKQTQTDNLKGQGAQVSNSSATNNNWNMHGGCCFIFLECLNGKLPWYVRRGRDDFNTKARRRGYVWMSQWLVPAMQRFAWTKKVVNTVMIKPFLKWGFKHYHHGGPAYWSYLKPVCWVWFGVWSFLGSTVRRQDYAQ